MKNWVCVFVLVAFVRLQFVCCCGSIEHGVTHSTDTNCCVEQCPPSGSCLPQDQCLPKVDHGCSCQHHSSRGLTAVINVEAVAPQIQFAEFQSTESGWIGSKSDCDCQRCKGCSHLPHLHASYLRMASSQEFDGKSLARKSASSLAGWSVPPRAGAFIAARTIQVENGVSILCQLGRLLI